MREWGSPQGCRTRCARHGAGDLSQHFVVATARQEQIRVVPAEHEKKNTDTQREALLRALLIIRGCQ